MSNRKLTVDELKDLHGGHYVEEYLQKPISRVARLLPFFDLKPNDVVADFACGTAMLLEVIGDKVSQYVGIDFSEDFIAAAVRRATQMGIRNATFECTGIVDYCQLHPEKFDKAFTLDFSEHIYDEMFLEIYRAIHRSLKPGGVLYLHTPNGDYLIEIAKKVGILEQFPQHVAVRNADWNRRLLDSVGFRSVRMRFISHYVAPLKQFHALSYLPFLGKYFQARLFVECIK